MYSIWTNLVLYEGGVLVADDWVREHTHERVVLNRAQDRLARGHVTLAVVHL